MKDEKKCSRIIQLISRLEVGEDVSLRSLARVLTPEQMAELNADWEAEKRSRKAPKPYEILKYESLLSRGLLLYGKYEANHTKISSYDSGRLIRKAQSALDKALEYACEIVKVNSQLRMWFDRDPEKADFGAPAGMPRIITSKSYDNECRGQKLPFSNTKRDLKITALASALEKLQGNNLMNLVEVSPIEIWSFKRCKDFDFSGFRF